MTDFSKLLSTKSAEKARKIIDFYDGKQDEYIIKQLSDVNSGRRDWRTRGLIPRTRNIVKMIINKSGLISNDKMPNIDVYNTAGGILDEPRTQLLMDLLKSADYEDLVKNIDPIIRALSTARCLIQWDEINQKFVFDILGLHNAATVLDEYKNLIVLIYRTSCDEEKTTFRIFTNELIQDIEVDAQGKEVIKNSLPNPYGFIPLATFHDTIKPRTGDHNVPPSDIVQLNEMVNLHITDSEYALKFMKYGAWVTNCDIDGGSASNTVQYGEVYNRLLPVQINNNSQEVIIGPTQVIKLNSMGVDSPFFDWKTPIVDLKPLDEIVESWVYSYAADWSVNIKSAGQGTASSGFQLVVEELDNIELKKIRQKQFSVGMEQVCNIMMNIINIINPGTFTPENKVVVTFSAPILPVDEMQDEQVWSLRIGEGRASKVDYFMTKFDLTKDQAIEKIAEIEAESSKQIESPINITA